MQNLTDDTLLRFLFEHCAVRGARVQLHQSLQEILKRQHCNPLAARLLGESLAAAALMSSTIKLEGRVALQARGEGALSLLVAECTNHGGLRGVIHLEDRPLENNSLENYPLEKNATPDTCNISDLLQHGYLAVSLLPDEGDSYQGLVPLEGDRLQDCLAGYFAQSEQLPTALWLACDGDRAAGFLLQALPGAENTDDWQRVCLLANTLTDEELLQLPHAQLLHRLFHEDTLRVFDPALIEFSCTCSQESSRSALTLLGHDDLQKLFAERGIAEVDCQFCGQHYCYTEADMGDVLGEHSQHIH